MGSSNKAMDRNLAMDSNKGTSRNLAMESNKGMAKSLGMVSNRDMESSSKATGRNLAMVSLKATASSSKATASSSSKATVRNQTMVSSPKATRIRMNINTSILRAAPRQAAETSTRRRRRPHTLQATLAGETTIRWAATWQHDLLCNAFIPSFHLKYCK